MVRTRATSLNYPRDFSIHNLKIDLAFIARMREGENAVRIVRAIAALGHALSARVTAEAIETETELAKTVAVGCDAGQGYAFARPAPALPDRPLPRPLSYEERGA